MTEQYSIGFGEGEQNGYNKAIDECASEINQLKAQVNCLREAALRAISYMTGGEAKANLRDAYDATPEQCLAEIKASAIEEMIREFSNDYSLGTS